MSDPIGLVVRFYLKPGHEQQFDRLVDETLSGIDQHEPGTLVYVSHTPGTKPDQRIFYELYRDRAAFAAHEAQAHVQHFLTERERYVLRYEVDFLTPLGLGVPLSGRTSRHDASCGDRTAHRGAAQEPSGVTA